MDCVGERLLAGGEDKGERIIFTMYRDNYCLNVWFTTIIGTPVLLIVYLITKNLPAIDFHLSYLGLILILIPIGFLVALPSLLFYNSILSYLSKQKTSCLIKKVLLSGIAAITLFLTFFLLSTALGFTSFSFFNISFAFIPVLYILTSVVSSLMFKISNQ